MKGKKVSRNLLKSTWKCKFNCKLTKLPCSHLEALLPKEESYSLLNQRQHYAGSNVDRHQASLPDRSKEKAEFLKRIGDSLMPVEIDILTLRYVYNETFSSIAKELKLLGTETVIRIHNEALTKLKKRLK